MAEDVAPHPGEHMSRNVSADKTADVEVPGLRRRNS
jgi:hypothetical protein